MPRDDDCEHGSVGYCGLCIAVGENKLAPDQAWKIHRGETPKSFEDAMTSDDDHHG